MASAAVRNTVKWVPRIFAELLEYLLNESLEPGIPLPVYLYVHQTAMNPIYFIKVYQVLAHSFSNLQQVQQASSPWSQALTWICSNLTLPLSVSVLAKSNVFFNLPAIMQDNPKKINRSRKYGMIFEGTLNISNCWCCKEIRFLVQLFFHGGEKKARIPHLCFDAKCYMLHCTLQYSKALCSTAHTWWATYHSCLSLMLAQRSTGAGLWLKAWVDTPAGMWAPLPWVPSHTATILADIKGLLLFFYFILSGLLLSQQRKKWICTTGAQNAPKPH